MKWYLHPQGDEYPTWQPQRMARSIPAAISLQKAEPQEATTGDGWALLPLTDAGSQPEAGQVVDERTVTVDTEEGTATAEYTYRSKTQNEADAEAQARRSGMVVSRFQARAALLAAGLLATIENAVAAYDGEDAALVQLAWSEATEWKRLSPTVTALATIVSLTDEQLDALFIAAAQIEA